MRVAIYIVAAVLAIGMLAWWLCFPPRGAALAAPALLKQWEDQVYGLDEGEVLRFVPPPFLAGRAAKMPPAITSVVQTRGINGQMVYYASPSQVRPLGYSTGSGTVGSALRWCTRTGGYEMGIGNTDPAAFGYVPADGDWVVRDDAPVERRVAALETILRSVTGRKLLIEGRPVERDVIVVSGKWVFKSVDERKEYRAGSIHLYTGALGPPGKTGRTSGNLEDLLSWLSKATRRKVLDETVAGAPQRVYWYNHSSLSAGAMNDFERDELLENLAKQTSLKFEQTRREIPVWTVGEEKADR